ncbi:type II toxin-antitoxin system VapB family antitoxin [Arthrobacter sp. NQ7]|uniref:type II toxin-antitoxin system VapB family antitoxin n=1 Tax=Arthrobacter sp. NQ7 TaxID=3032303 RepID=UPI001154F28A|nr:type II toxin-antitoxin system VapB family antitoxin [Arthrobacter sp. NQ7]MDJ0460037.1 type II toxin-antitoxin system VapB family antitoxin [Arthrobacter sp. NQ7]
MTTATPIKVDQQTDRLISHAAHFFGKTKKAVVDEAMRQYIESHRSELAAAIKDAMTQLDGSNASVVSMMTGLSPEELDELGGVPEQ